MFGVAFYGDNVMSFNRRDFLAAGTAAAASIGFSGTTLAQAAPESVKLFVGFPGGTTPDVLARKVGDQLTKGYARAARAFTFLR